MYLAAQRSGLDRTRNPSVYYRRRATRVVKVHGERWIGPAISQMDWPCVDGKSRCSGRSTPQVLTLKPPRADKVSLHLCLSHDAVPCRCLWLCAERAGAHRVARPRRVDGRREDGVRRRSRYKQPSCIPAAQCLRSELRLSCTSGWSRAGPCWSTHRNGPLTLTQHCFCCPSR